MRQKTFFPGMHHDIMMSSEWNASAFHCLINIISFFFSFIVQSSRYHINYPIDVNCSDNKQKLCISKLSKTECFISGIHSGNFGDIIAYWGFKIWNHQSNCGYHVFTTTFEIVLSSYRMWLFLMIRVICTPCYCMLILMVHIIFWLLYMKRHNYHNTACGPPFVPGN